MEAFIQRYSKLLGSVLYLVVGLLLAGYSVFYTATESSLENAKAAFSLYREENQQIKELLAIRNKTKDDVQQEASIRSLPEFLTRINEVAKKTEIIIRKLMPKEKSDKLIFEMEIVEDYYRFLRFTALLESLNVIIHDIQVRPYDSSKTPPVHAISFSLTPRNDAEPLAGERIEKMNQEVAQENKRNPFQRFALSKTGNVKAEIDLTWIYKLSGIGSVGGQRIATIEGRDYTVGGAFEGMEILNIDPSGILMIKKTPNGETKYVMKFRQKKTGNKDGK